jgi:preprotein translocase subunit SecE
MARDRKRSKQRQQRRARPAGDQSVTPSAALGAADPQLAPAPAPPSGDPVADPTADPVGSTSMEPDFDAPVRPAFRETDYHDEEDESSVGGVAVGERVPRAPARPAKGNRVTGFLRASWAELQRVQWPNRQQVFQATAVVLGFVVIAGAFLAGADWVAGKIVDAIL